MKKILIILLLCISKISFAQNTHYANEEKPFGFIYNVNTWSSLSDFTVTGATASVGSNAINVSGGANNFSQTIDINGYSCLEKWTYTAKIKITSKSSTTYGFALGTHSIEADNNPPNIAAYFNATSSGGTVAIYGGQGTSLSAVATSSQLTWSVNDIVYITFKRYYNILSAVVYDITNNSSVSIQYAMTYGVAPYQPNTGHFTVYNLGGTYTIDSIGIYSNEIVNARLAVIGDSKASGSVTSGFNKRFSTLLNQNYTNTITWAGPGDEIRDMILRLPELAKLKPRAVIFEMGSNDLGAGTQPAATIYAQYDSVVNFCKNNGIIVYHTLLFPQHNGLDVTAFNAHIIATYPASNIIDCYTPLVLCDNCWADSYHPNDKGDSVIYETIKNSGKLLTSENTYKNDYIRDQNLISMPGNIWINGIIKTDSTIYSSQLHVSGQGFFNNDRLYTSDEGYQGAPSIHSTTYLYSIADLDIHVFRGGNADITHDGVIQIEQSPGLAQNVTGEFRFLNTNVGIAPNAPSYIYTSGQAIASNFIGGDLWIMTNIGGNVGNGSPDYVTQYGNASLFLKAAGTGAVKPWLTQFQSGIGFFRRAIANVNATIAITDYQISFTTLTGTKSVTLPTASSVANQHFVIQDEAGTAGSNNITIVGTVNGSVNPTAINTNFGTYRLYSNGTAYFKE